jgi:hypothetical protein
VTRPHIALAAAALAVLLLVPATATAAWSTQQQVKGFLSEGRPAISVDEAGTLAVGISTVIPVAGASYVERPTGLAEWNSAGVKITQITGAPPSATFALSPSGAAVVVWATGSSLNLQPWAAYKPPGKAWGAAVQLDTARSFEGPIPLIDEAGHAAVVWAHKSTGSTYVLNMPNEVLYAAPNANAVWPASPTKLADITVPTPHDEDPEGGFSFNGCSENLHAAILPGGTPVASWNDPYGSWKQIGGANDDFERALCGVRVSSGGAPVAVTPRPAVGWYADAAASMPNWTQDSLVASGTNTRTGAVVRGLEDSLQIGGCAEGNACAKNERETKVLLGTGTSLSVAGGNLVGINAVAALALRDERSLVVTDSTATVLRAGVGTGFPTLNALPEDFQMFSAGLALNDAGAAHVAAVPNNTTVFGFRLFNAPAAGSFGLPQVVDGPGASRTPALALDCKGLPVMAWSRSSSNQIFTSNFDTAPSVCGAGPQPEPEVPSGGGGGSGGGPSPGTAPTGPTVVQSPPPVPSSLATIGKPDVDSSGSKVSFQITCSPLTGDACNGKTVITKSNGGKARIAAKKAAVLGSVSFAGLKPGKSRILKVPLVASAKQALKAGKSLKVVITATVRSGSGPAKVSTKAATLRLPAR